MHSAPVQLVGDAAAVDALAIDRLKGEIPVETVSGRPPVAPGEIAVGPRTAQRLGLVEGGRVEVVGPAGPVPLTVTGIVVVRSEERTPLGSAVLVVPEQLTPVALNTPILDAAVRAVPGHADVLFRELSSRLEVYPPEVPDEVRNLGDLRMLPGAARRRAGRGGRGRARPRPAHGGAPALAGRRRSRRAGGHARAGGGGRRRDGGGDRPARRC